MLGSITLILAGFSSYAFAQNGLELGQVSPWQDKFLILITNPTVVYLLILIGFYGLIYEFSTPGAIFPGIIGVILLLISFFGLHQLPINYFGLGLLVLGLALMFAEAFIPSFGTLGLGGIIAFIMGSMILIDTEKSPDLKIPRSLIFTLAGVSAGFIFVVTRMAVKARKRKIVTGAEALIGSIGTAEEDFFEHGNIWIHGELWKAHCDSPIKKAQAVRIIARQGLELKVEPCDEEESIGG